MSKTNHHILALVSDAFGGHGGIALYNRDLLTALCSYPDVDSVTAIPRFAPSPIGELPEKLTYIMSGLGGKAKYAASILKLMFSASRVDLIICGHVNLLPLAFLLRARFRVPVLLMIYGIDAWQPTKSRITNFLVRRTSATVSISEITKQKFESWSHYPEKNIHLLPNAIHAERYGVAEKNQQLVSRYGLEGKVVLMTLGRLAAQEQYKGFDEILECLPLLSQSIPNIIYMIAGDGDDRKRLEAKAAKLGVSDHVIFAGMVPESEKADHFRLADLYVMPSHGEGFGFVLLEAMACGVPVIASKTDGGREAVRNGELGTLVSPDKPDEIIAAIKSSLSVSNKYVPAGLQYFSFGNFSQRLHGIIARHI